MAERCPSGDCSGPADVVFDVVVDRAILLDGAGTELITLNAVGTVVWNELDGRRDAAELAADLLDRFVGRRRSTSCGVDIAAFLDELAALGLAVDATNTDTSGC